MKRLREDAEAVFRAGLEAVDPIRAVERHVGRANDTLTVGERDYDLSKFERIFVVGAGKASAAMGQAIETVLGDAEVPFEAVQSLIELHKNRAG